MSQKPFVPRHRGDAWSMLATMVCILAVLFMLGLGVKHALDMPTVYVSSKTHACVDVIGPLDAEGEEQYSCSNMPKRYDTTWVSGDYTLRK